jgi:hypothetical protein
LTPSTTPGGWDATGSRRPASAPPTTWPPPGWCRPPTWRPSGSARATCATPSGSGSGGWPAPASDRNPWLGFRTITNERWHHGNVLLAGDAAHTTHFTIGSGTKLAIEDAIGLATALGDHGDLESALDAYEQDRRRALLLLQREARNSARWFENLPRYIRLDSAQFAVLLHHRRSPLLTRMSPAGYYRLRRTTERLPLFERLWHWASGRDRARYVRRANTA